MAFQEHGYRTEIFSPDGGKLEGDRWSDPRDESGYSADDLISLGFIATLFVGGQGPMCTFHENSAVHAAAVRFYEAGKILAVVCHATCMLLKLRTGDGRPLVAGKTWTGYADSEERYADRYVGRKIQPFSIESEARKRTRASSSAGAFARSRSGTGG